MLRKQAILIVFAFISLNAYSIQAQLLSDSPRSDFYVTDGDVLSMAQSEGVTYIAGNFQRVLPYLGRGVAIDTATTGAYDANYPKVNGTIWSVISDGSGGWYIGGDFTYVNNTARNRIAHIKSDKTLDASWNPNVNGIIRDMALDAANSTLYIGGDFTTVGGNNRSRLAAISTTTGNVTAFLNNTNSNVYSLHLNGTTLYVGGSFTFIGGLSNDSSRNYLASINLTTGLVSKWKPAVTGTIYTIATRDTFVYVGGDFLGAGGRSRQRIAEFFANSDSVTSWTANANDIVYSVSVVDSLVYMGGAFTQVLSNTRNRIARVRTDGLISPWRVSGTGVIRKIITLSDKIYVAGQFTQIGSAYPRNNIACIPSSFDPLLTGINTFPTPWNPNLGGAGSSAVYAIALSGTTIYAGGSFTSAGAGYSRKYLAAITSSTGVPTSWNPITANGGIIRSIGIRDTVLYTAGDFTTINVTGRNRLAAFGLSSGNMTNWNPNAGASVSAIFIQDSIIYAAGSFTTMGGSTRNRVAAIKADATGSLVTTWAPSVTGGGGAATSIAVFDTVVYIGGNFTTIGGTTRNRLAAVSASNGALLSSWNPNLNNSVNSISIDGSNNRLYIGGNFTSVGATTRNRIAALNLSDGSLVSGWNPNSDNNVNTIVQRASEVFVGGDFTTIGGQSRSRLASLNKSDGNATSWNPSANGTVSVISSTDSLVGVGGTFTGMGTEAHNNFVAFSAPAAPQIIRALRDTSIAWNSGTHTIESNLYDVFNDADSPTLTFGASLQNGNGITVAIVGNALQITTKTDSLGSYNILVTATDPQSQSISDVVNVTIYRPNEAPFVQTPARDTTFSEDFAKSFVVKLGNVFKDNFGGTLSYTAAANPSKITTTVSGDSLYLIGNADQNGLVDIRLTANDGQYTAYDTFTVSVTPVNDPPVRVLTIADQNVSEDFAKTFVRFLPAVFSDVDNASLTYSAAYLSAGVDPLVSGDSLYILSTLNFTGSVDIRVDAGDGEYTVYDTFTVNVTPINDAPFVLSPIVNQNISEDFGRVSVRDLTTVFDDVDNATLNYSADVIQSGVTASITNDSLYLNSVLNFNGTAIVVITAGDGLLSVTDTFDVVVDAVNDAPIVISAIVDQNLAEDFGRVPVRDLTTVFDDVDNATLNYYADVIQTGVTASITNDSLYLNSVLNFNGTAIVVITAGDGLLSVTDTFNVDVNAVNNAPVVVSPIANQNLSEDFGRVSVRDLTTVFDDVDNPTLNYSADVIQPGVTASITNDSLYLNSVLNFNGTAVVVITAGDGLLSVTDTFDVVVNAVNDAPIVISAIVDQNLAEDFGRVPVRDLTTVFDDVDNATLNYSADVIQPGVTASITNDSLYLNSVLNFNGTAIVVITAGDGLLSVTDTFNVVVDAVNNAPVVVSPIANQNLSEDFGRVSVRDLTTVFDDVDNPTLNYSADVIQTGVTASITNDSLYLNSVLNFNGTAIVVITASDGFLSITDTFNVDITPVNDIPTAFNLLVPADEDSIDNNSDPIVFSWSSSLDVDGDALEYVLSIQGPSLDTVISGITDTTFSFTDVARLLTNSTYNWWVSVDDGIATVACIDSFEFYTKYWIGIDPDLTTKPVSFTLYQNYPNPFNPTTTIRYALPEKARVVVRVYNMLGQEIRTLVNGEQNAGYQTVIWNGLNNHGQSVASGVYIYTLEAGSFKQVRKMLMIK